MKIRKLLVITTIALLATGVAGAQDAVSDVEDPNEVLKIAALEALLSAPPERALPLVTKVLDAEKNVSLEIEGADAAVLCTTDDGYGYVIMPLARDRMAKTTERETSSV